MLTHTAPHTATVIGDVYPVDYPSNPAYAFIISAAPVEQYTAPIGPETAPTGERERVVAPRITLSQARTLAAFETLNGYLTEVEREGIGRCLRANTAADDVYRTGVKYVDVTIDGAAYVRLAAGGWNFIPREECRAILRDLLSAGA